VAPHRREHERLEAALLQGFDSGLEDGRHVVDPPAPGGDSDRTAGVEGIECQDVFEGRDGRGVQVVDGGLVARPADAVGAREVLDTGVGGCFEALAVGKDELHRYLLSVERGLMSCPVVGFAAWKAPTPWVSDR